MIKALSSALLAAAAMAGVSIAGAPSTANANSGSTTHFGGVAHTNSIPAKLVQQLRFSNSVMASIFGGAGSGNYRLSYPKRGWSVKQGQRMARKNRNQKRNRRAQRG